MAASFSRYFSKHSSDRGREWFELGMALVSSLSSACELFAQGLPGRWLWSAKRSCHLIMVLQ